MLNEVADNTERHLPFFDHAAPIQHGTSDPSIIKPALQAEQNCAGALNIPSIPSHALPEQVVGNSSL
jgi:hypothetical protein